MSVFKDAYVKGNLTITGRSTAVTSTNMLVADPFMVVNANVTATQTYTGGIAINYEVLGSVPATVFDNGTATITCGDLTSVVADNNADFVLVAGSSHNNGVYEVLTRTTSTIVINPDPVADYLSLKSLVDESSSPATVSAVNIMVIQSDGTGNLQVGTGSDGTTVTNNFTNVGMQGGAGTFDTINLEGNANQIVLDSDGLNPGTITLAPQTTGSTFTIPDVGSGDFVMTTGAQTITGVKTMTTPIISGALALDDSDSVNNLNFISTSTLTANRLLTVDVNDVDRTLTFGGNLTIANDFTTSGDNPLTLTTTGTTNVTLPTTGTLATLDGTETLTNKTILASNTSVNTNYTALLTDNLLVCTTAGTDITITLPVVSSANGKKYTIVLEAKGVGDLIINPNGTDELEGVASADIRLDVVNQTLNIISDGTSWRII